MPHSVPPAVRYCAIREPDSDRCEKDGDICSRREDAGGVPTHRGVSQQPLPGASDTESSEQVLQDSPQPTAPLRYDTEGDWRSRPKYARPGSMESLAESAAVDVVAGRG